MICCLYEICFPNGKRYFGITNNFSRRMSEHRGEARRGSDLLVHAAMRKYGADYTARKLVVGERDYIMDLEIKAISAFGTDRKNLGYNITPGGFLPSEQSRESRRISTGRRWEDPEYRNKMISLRIGKPLSADHRASISAALTGRPVPPERGVKISKALSGRKLSAEAAEAQRARLTPEVREKISAAQKGRPSNNGVTERNKSRTGEKRTPEQRAKMSAAIAANWMARKEASAKHGSQLFPNRKERKDSRKSHARVSSRGEGAHD